MLSYEISQAEKNVFNKVEKIISQNERITKWYFTVEFGGLQERSEYKIKMVI